MLVKKKIENLSQDFKASNSQVTKSFILADLPEPSTGIKVNIDSVVLCMLELVSANSAKASEKAPLSISMSVQKAVET